MMTTSLHRKLYPPNPKKTNAPSRPIALIFDSSSLIVSEEFKIHDMIRRIIHIASPACLSVRCRQLVIRGEESDETVVPLEDVATIVIDHPQTSLTASVLGYCGEIGICVVHCGFDRMPSALSVPIVTNARSGYHLSEQLAVSIPNKKRLWALIVREKILAQSSVLALYGRDDDGLVGIADSVRSGDTDNAE